MKRLTDLIIIFGLCLTIAIVSGGISLVYITSINTMNQDFENRVKEDECIKQLITKGIKREDIIRLEGSCIYNKP